MKSMTSIFLAALLVLTLAACGGAPAPSAPPSAAPAPASEAPAPSSAAPAPSSAAPAPSSTAPAPSSTAPAPSSAAPAPSSAAPAPSSAAPAPSSTAPASSAAPAPSAPASSAAPQTAGSITEFKLLPNGSPSPMGIKELTVLIPVEGVEPGDAELTVYDASDNSEVFSISLDSSGVEFLDWSTANKGAFPAAAGTALRITLDEALEAGRNYYVQTEADWLILAETGASAPAITDKKTWTIRVSDFGILYDTNADGVVEVALDQTVAFPCFLGEKAVKAKATVSPKDSAELAEKELSEDGELSVTFKKKGTMTLTVEFFDAGGKSLATIAQSVKCK